MHFPADSKTAVDHTFPCRQQNSSGSYISLQAAKQQWIMHFPAGSKTAVDHTFFAVNKTAADWTFR